ncbi:MAG: helix-turn-helix transcriptional regulator [Desulfuromusa sp.]|nr:helix-turn-helix transcriptional regulator [Desulfuromusa sp.]
MTKNLPRRRSGCPISFSLDLIGDKWTLLVLHDLIFGRKKHFRDFLASPEKIATNILANRLKSLKNAAIITRHPDPEHARQVIYSNDREGSGLNSATARYD